MSCVVASRQCNSCTDKPKHKSRQQAMRRISVLMRTVSSALHNLRRL